MLTAQEVSALYAVANNLVPTFTLSKTTALVSENGTQDNFTIVLDAEPSGDVKFQITSDNTSEVTVSPDNLTFTNSNRTNYKQSY